MLKEQTKKKHIDDRFLGLEQSAQRFQTIFEHAPVMIDSFDADGNCLLWNNECVKHLGWTFEEIRDSKDSITLFYPDPADRILVMEHIKAADGIFREYRPLAKDGTVRVQQWADFCLPDGTKISAGYDVTEQKAAEHARRESEDKYRSFFNLASNGIVLIDCETGMIVECNLEFERQTGRSLEELKSTKIWNLRPPEERERARKACESIVKNGEGGSADLHFMQPNGETVPIEFRGKVVNIAGSTYIHSVTVDITTRRKTEAELKASVEKYRQIFTEARDGIVLAGDDGLIVDCNPEFERQTGRSLSILRKMHVWELRPKDEVERAKYLFGQLQEHKVIDVSEQQFEKPDGEIVFVELRGRDISVGGVHMKQAITRDISKRKQTEAALYERDERVRMLVSQVPAILWTTDRKLRFTSSVGAGLESLGLAPGQVIGMSLYDYFQTDDPEFESIAMHRRVLKGESVTFLSEWDSHVFEAHVQPLRDKNGIIIGCLALALDVTERVTAEKKLKRSEKQLRALASRVQKVREEESAGIAREIHDELGQNLTGLKMDIAWIQRRIGNVESGCGAGEVMERLRMMGTEVDEIVQTVRRISTQLRPVILDDLGLLRALEWQATEFQGRTGIVCDFNSETRSGLESDPSTAVFRIFQEILTNVARHAGAKRVAVKLRDENGMFVLDVVDDGKGISEDEMKGSRALGILGMQERAQVCGGDVVIRPNGGGGTRVTVKVPVE